jgi:hypothetical protein
MRLQNRTAKSGCGCFTGETRSQDGSFWAEVTADERRVRSGVVRSGDAFSNPVLSALPAAYVGEQPKLLPQTIRG